MTAGRPTSYSQEKLDLAKDYLANCPDKVPSVAGLSVVLHISRETIYDWASQENKKEFSDTIRELSSKQEAGLINGGLGKDFDSGITKLMLSANHGYREKSDVTTDGKSISEEKKSLSQKAIDSFLGK